jgi:hypothetical protein
MCTAIDSRAEPFSIGVCKSIGKNPGWIASAVYKRQSSMTISILSRIWADIGE